MQCVYNHACLCTCLRVTPPLLVRSIQGGFRRYAVHKGSVRSTQKFCYIVRRYHFFTLKRSNFHQKHNTHDIQSQIILKKIARSLRSRLFGIISAFINLNMDLRRSKSRNLTSKHIKPNVFKN